MHRDVKPDNIMVGAHRKTMLAGDPPFGGRSAQAVVSKLFASGPPSIRDVRPDVPITIADALKRALSRSRQDRFASISDFAATLHIASREGRDGIGGAVSRLAKRLRV